ncbi:hypothetical protein TCAL_15470, partial [Tigriopus californicus]
HCRQYLENLPTHQNEPLIQTSSTHPFQQVSADLFEYGWPFVHLLTVLDTYTIVNYWWTFCMWSFPSQIRTDGRPQFRSQITAFCGEYGVERDSASS